MSSLDKNPMDERAAPDLSEMVEIASPDDESQAILMSSYLGAFGVSAALVSDDKGGHRLLVAQEDFASARQLLSQTQFG